MWQCRQLAKRRHHPFAAGSDGHRGANGLNRHHDRSSAQSGKRRNAEEGRIKRPLSSPNHNKTARPTGCRFQFAKNHQKLLN